MKMGLKTTKPPKPGKPNDKKPGGKKNIPPVRKPGGGPVPKPVTKPGGTPGIKPGPAPRPIGRRGKPSPDIGIVSGGPKPRLLGYGSKKFPGVM